MNEIEKRTGTNTLKLRLENSSYSSCHRCGLPWNKCESKSITYFETKVTTRGIFAMCTYCWDHSSLDERLHHYKTLWYENNNRWNYCYDWSVIEKNIIAESN